MRSKRTKKTLRGGNVTSKQIISNICSHTNNGTTLSDMTYYLPLGNYGTHQNSLLIYGKNICISCSGKIDKLFIDSRATYMCKKCQK